MSKKGYGIVMLMVLLNVACSPVQAPQPQSPCGAESGASPYSLEAIALQQRCAQQGK